MGGEVDMQSVQSVQAIRNKNGQFVIEAVLLMVVAIGIIMAGTKIMREQKLLAKIVAEPWAAVSTMSELGVWPSAKNQLHPNNFNRVRTPDPK